MTSNGLVELCTMVAPVMAAYYLKRCLENNYNNSKLSLDTVH